MTTVAELLNNGRIDRRETELLLQHALTCDRTWLITHNQQELDPTRAARIETLIDRRAAGEPVAYLMGEREFWGLDLSVSPSVLIPRPDTEVLVEWALEQLRELAEPALLDLGTGSGAIALAIKQACPSANISAVDVSEAALSVAASNGQALALEVNWIESDWFTHIPDRGWPVIVSNPPYIAESDPHLSEGDLPFEPVLALTSGHDGLDAIRLLIKASPQYLSADGWLLLEHGYDQGDAVRGLMVERGFTDVETRRDLAGHERVTGGVWRAQ